MRQKQSVRIGKERKESGMVGRARMNGKMDHWIFLIGAGTWTKNGANMSGNDSSEE